MCTRFYIETNQSDALQSTLKSVQRSSLTAFMQEQLGRNVITYGEVRPTDIAIVIASNKNGVRAVFPMIWGFTAPFRPTSHHQEHPEKTSKGRSGILVNCRVETASKKPLWKDSWAKRRCIIPASCYFEWGPPATDQKLLSTLKSADGRTDESGDRKIKGKTESKIKYAIRPKDEAITYLAGLYRIENGYPHFAVLTREPGEDIRLIHDRMPVILKQDSIDAWINPYSQIRIIDEIAQTSLTGMDYQSL